MRWISKDEASGCLAMCLFCSAFVFINVPRDELCAPGAVPSGTLQTLKRSDIGERTGQLARAVALRQLNGVGAGRTAAATRCKGEEEMTVEALIIWLIIGAVAGFLAGLIVEGYGFGVVGNIVVGIVGAVIAGALFPRLGLFPGGGIGMEIISATVGAVILLILLGLVRRA